MLCEDVTDKRDVLCLGNVAEAGGSTFKSMVQREHDQGP
jgi:hypothetical protein